MRYLSVSEFLERVPIARSTLYELIARGEVATAKVGDRRLIPESEAELPIATDLVRDDAVADQLRARADQGHGPAVTDPAALAHIASIIGGGSD
jgi:excisionase family DNA binding protein